MGVHVYCIVASSLDAPRELTGITGARVDAAQTKRLAVWYSEHDVAPAADDVAIRAHHAVVQSAMTAEHTPVPVRFGQWFGSVGDALAQVSAEEAKWQAQLERFAGCVEFGVSITAPEPQAARDVHPTRESGTAYMAALAERHAEAQRRRAEGEAIALRMQEALAGLVVDVRVELLGTAGLARLAHLVARPRQDRYHAALAEIRRARPDLTFRCSGPWPPYSFVA
jgi:hypothetical protein